MYVHHNSWPESSGAKVARDLHGKQELLRGDSRQGSYFRDSPTDAASTQGCVTAATQLGGLDSAAKAWHEPEPAVRIAFRVRRSSYRWVWVLPAANIQQAGECTIPGGKSLRQCSSPGVDIAGLADCLCARKHRTILSQFLCFGIQRQS